MNKILILAVSKKHGGFCVAGKDVDSNKWLRLVSDPNGGALTETHTRFIDIEGNIYNDPIHKILEVELGRYVPLIYQPENYMISGVQWRQSKNIHENVFIDTPKDLWGEGDRISNEDICHGKITIESSLYQIKALCINFHTKTFEGKLKRRLSFDYNGHYYDLASTMSEQTFDDIKNGTKTHNNLITVSLSDPFKQHDNSHYKLAAGIY